ncbi:MAG: transcriptional regulator with XRE-family HTH domain [Myxococcota bacterium]|jgi:transcriptional regulator with XRE-family HTH domain
MLVKQHSSCFSARVDTSRHLATNLKHLRILQGLTQLQAASRADVPRPTWTGLESGAGNPTLSVLVRVAAALNVSVDELIGPPRAECQLFRAADLPTKERRDVTIRALLPEALVGLQLERLAFGPHGSMRGQPHTTGTREYLTCERGRIELAVAGQRFELGPGDVVVFRGDQKHGYRNLSDGQSIAYSVISWAASH